MYANSGFVCDVIELLSLVKELLFNIHYEVIDSDSIVVLEAPKIAGTITLMRENISQTLKVTSKRVSVKATAHEGLGPLGKREDCAVFAVSTLRCLDPV